MGPRAVVLFHRLGPYHHSRLQAAGRLGDVKAVEIVAVDAIYRWDRVVGADRFGKVTLFESDVARERSLRELKTRLCRSLEDADPKVVFVPGWSEPYALLAISWCANGRIPVVFMSESQEIDAPRTWWKERVKKRIVALCSSGLVGGAPQKDYLADCGMARERIFTAYASVNNDHFAAGADRARKDADEPRGRPGISAPYFLSVNRFVAKKNLLRLIESYAAYRKVAGGKAWKLVLLGDGPLMSKIRDLRERLALGDHVLLPGFRQYEELPDWYGLASAYVQASVSEQWGLVVNEAMAAGLPVIVSDRCGCARDLVVEGVNGFTFDPNDTNRLSDLMTRMSGGEYDLAGMGRESRRIVDGWSPEKFAHGFWKAADTAMSAPRVRATPADRILLKVLARR